MNPDVLIIGGGLSGLSAAVELSLRGISVLLLEQRPFLGGRTYSFIDEVTGDMVDNGQHLLMGCYTETRRYLRTIGSESLAHLQPNLHIDFLHPQNGISSLSCPPLPAPFHLVGGMLGLRTLRFIDRLKLMRVGLELQKSPETVEPRIASMTVDGWMTSLGQPELNKKYLWDIIAIGSLNDNPKTVSALLFYRVLRTAFTGAKENSSLLVPRVGLSELLVDPAVRFIRSKGGEVRTSCGGESLTVEREGWIGGLRCVDGSELGGKSYLSAIPYYGLESILPSSERETRNLKIGLTQFESSPIMTINLWLDRPVLDREFVAFLDSHVQWIFNRSRMLGERWTEREGRQQFLSLVISGAAEYVEWSKERMVDVAMKEMGAALPAARDARVLHSLIVKEKRATFSPKPYSETLRRSLRSPFKNLFLAGDWTDTGYPATIEGAVMSGVKSAVQVANFLRESNGSFSYVEGASTERR